MVGDADKIGKMQAMIEVTAQKEEDKKTRETAGKVRALKIELRKSGLTAAFEREYGDLLKKALAGSN